MTRSRTSIFSVVLHLLPAFLLCALFAAVGIMHVSSRVLVVRVGYKLSELQGESRSLTRENDRLKLELATLKTPNRLEKTARDQLGMMAPHSSQVVTLLPGPVHKAQPKQLAQSGTPSRLGRRSATP